MSGSKKRTPDLSKEEQEHVRVALRAYWMRIGTRDQVAALLGVTGGAIRNAANGATVSVLLAFRLARRLDAPIDDVLAGRYHPPGPCAYCGRES